MIDRKLLLDDLQRLLKKIEADLRERSDEPEIAKVLKAEYETAKSAARTAATYEAWRVDYITQIAAAWVLSTVFVRFLEDNQLIDPPKLSGLGERLQRARDEYDLYVRKEPAHSVREYLLSVFDELATLPGGSEIFGEHNPLHAQRTWISGDAAKELRNFWQELSPDTGEVVHDFTDDAWDTRFLGDLYQDLSEAARKKYALLQTPDFVEEFILDRTLEPALDEFGLVVSGQSSVTSGDETTDHGHPTTDNFFKMIDPACGSGHFLLGTFPRILDRWQKKEPGTNVRELVQRTLHSIHGVDINPFAIAIARFRLLLVALQASGIHKLKDAPAFYMNLACGDSLYHGLVKQQEMDFGDEHHFFQTENAAELNAILQEGAFHAVVANPPYIVPKDKAANTAYRALYQSCHMKYSLAVPFMERIFRLAARGDGNGQAAGYTGQITANSFMKREFGKKLIEAYLPTIDLTHVVDTSGAYIPGHGTPTVILLGREREPVAATIRTVMGIRGEPSTPDNPAHGLVWTAITKQIDHPGSESEFVSAGDTDRERFETHPWSIGGGGAAELKERLDATGAVPLRDVAEEIGFFAITGEDDAFVADQRVFQRAILPSRFLRQFSVGDTIRDWYIANDVFAIFPYENELHATDDDKIVNYFWPLRSCVVSTLYFGKDKVERGMVPHEYVILLRNKLRTPLSIVFAFVATHNHFVLDRGGKVFKQSAPVIKLPDDATEDDHLGLLGLLNSSVGCFWMKQTFHNKGDSTDQHGARTTGEVEFNSYEFSGTGMKDFPLLETKPLELARSLDARSRLGSQVWETPGSTDCLGIESARVITETTREQMVMQQEELDWWCYHAYGLVEELLCCTIDPFPVKPGERAFEFILARKMAKGEVQSKWYERHGRTPFTELPNDWPDDYKKLVQRRIEVIESNPQIALIEQPEYKRRWNTEPWDSQVERSLRSWLLDRLESYFDFDGRMAGEPEASAPGENHKLDIRITSIAQLADIAAKDKQFLEVAEVYRDRSDFDVVKLVAELVAGEHVPLLPVLRYKPSGLDKRVAWERTWELQRAEDELSLQCSVLSVQLEEASDEAEIDRLKTEHCKLKTALKSLDIPVPPKYASKDFISTGGAKYWKLRGKLDVPKERWISFPHCEDEDQTLPIAWAGYDHLQQVQAISAYFAEVQEKGGSDDPRLTPLLGCIQQLIPWLKQWHNDIHPEFGYRLGDYFEGFVKDEARTLGLTVEDVQHWEPPKKKRGK